MCRVFGMVSVVVAVIVVGCGLRLVIVIVDAGLWLVDCELCTVAC